MTALKMAEFTNCTAVPPLSLLDKGGIDAEFLLKRERDQSLTNSFVSATLEQSKTKGTSKPLAVDPYIFRKGISRGCMVRYRWFRGGTNYPKSIPSKSTNIDGATN